MAKISRVIHVARECAQITPGGGVGDVVLELALKCAAEGVDSSVVLPHYKNLKLEPTRIGPVYNINIPMAYTKGKGRHERAEISLNRFQIGTRELLAWLVDSPRFRRKSHPYTYTAEEEKTFRNLPPEAIEFCGAERPPFQNDEAIKGRGHYDYFAMNVLLQKAAVHVIQGTPGPTVVHGHDAHAAGLPLVADAAGIENCRFITTAHNCGRAYRQQCYDEEFVAAILGITVEETRRCSIDGAFDPFAAAALYGHHLNTVSEGYAWEVEMGRTATSGGDDDLRAFSSFLGRHNKRILGITNGVDPSLKGPEALPESLRPETVGDGFAWKAGFKRTFLRRGAAGGHWLGVTGMIGGLGAFDPRRCLFTFVGRLADQKAPDVLIRAVEEVFDADDSAALCILGDSDEEVIRKKMWALVNRYPGRVQIFTGFSEALSAEIYAAGDFFLIPSRFEPCGLIDYIAQLNGNIPIANQVGGLSKIIDDMTGLTYFALDDRHNLRGLVATMRRALQLFQHPQELELIRRAGDARVRARHTWDEVFPKYYSLYGFESLASSIGN